MKEIKNNEGEKKEQEVKELLLDVLFQACGYTKNNKDMIDNEGLSVYEWACVFLEKEGLLKKVNDRIYLIVEGDDKNGKQN